MTTHGLLRPPARLRRPPELQELAWPLAAAILAGALGLLLGAAPIAALALAGAGAVVVAFTNAPWLVVLAILLLRPSLDTSDAVFSVGGVNLAGFINVALALGVPAALVWLRPRLPARPLIAIVAAVLLWAMASATWSTTPAGDALRTWLGFAAPFLALVLVAGLTTGRDRLQTVVTVVLLSSVLPMLVGLYQYFVGGVVVKEGFASVPGPFVHPNGFGFFLMIVLVLSVVRLMETRDPVARRLLVAHLAVGAFLLLNTYARAAWIGTALVVVVLALVQYRRLILVGVLGIVLVAAVVPSTLTSVASRFADVTGNARTYDQSSVDWRFRTWERMWPNAVDRPLTGHGIGSYLPLSNAEFGVFDYEYQTDQDDNYANLPVYAHNDYLVLAIEFGVPGLALWIAMLAALVASLVAAAWTPAVRPYAVAAAGLAVALAAGSVTDNVKDYAGALMPALAVAAAVLGAAAAHRRDAAHGARVPT